MELIIVTLSIIASSSTSLIAGASHANATTTSRANSTAPISLPATATASSGSLSSDLASIFLGLAAPAFLISGTSDVKIANGTSETVRWFAIEKNAAVLPQLLNRSQSLHIDSVSEIAMKRKLTVPFLPKSTSRTTTEPSTTTSPTTSSKSLKKGLRPEEHMKDFPHCAVRTPLNVNDSTTWSMEPDGTSDADGIPIEQLDTLTYPEVANFTLRKHNCVRSLVEPSAGNMLRMEWNDEAAAQAQAWADMCDYQHNNETNRTTSDFPCGQNIAYTTPWPFSWNSVINMWFSERWNFTYGQPNELHIVGHYTAMTWATTYQLGCAYKDCNGWHYYVCHYCPNGNIGDLSAPYKKGKPCEACPNDCDQGLCTNSCKHVNHYSNCDEMEAKYHICSSKFQDHLAGHCKATCLCKGAIYG